MMVMPAPRTVVTPSDQLLLYSSSLGTTPPLVGPRQPFSIPIWPASEPSVLDHLSSAYSALSPHPPLKVFSSPASVPSLTDTLSLIASGLAFMPSPDFPFTQPAEPYQFRHKTLPGLVYCDLDFSYPAPPGSKACLYPNCGSSAYTKSPAPLEQPHGMMLSAPSADSSITFSTGQNLGTFSEDGRWYPCPYISKSHATLFSELSPPFSPSWVPEPPTDAVATSSGQFGRLDSGSSSKPSPFAGPSMVKTLDQPRAYSSLPTNNSSKHLNVLPPHLLAVHQTMLEIDSLYDPLKGVGVFYGRPTLLTPKSSHRSQCLEVVWTHHFRILFSQVRGQWSLRPTESPTEGANMFRDMAKVRFTCQCCRNGWTSMFGVVLFYYKWQASKHRGTVHFMLMGQRCNRCQRHHHFQTPMWYPEEAEKVMTNLFYEVCAKVYGLIVPPMIRERRYGSTRHQHDVAQCQGCVLALCKPGHSSDPNTPRRIGEKKSDDEEA